MERWLSRNIETSSFLDLLSEVFMNDNLLIARSVKKTINYIEKNIYNFPNEYKVLKERIINSCYDILENVYRANLDQNICYKREVLVQIKMLNYYLKQALDKEIITKKKFLNYGNHLLEIHNMVNSWCGYEKSEQYISQDL